MDHVFASAVCLICYCACCLKYWVQN